MLIHDDFEILSLLEEARKLEAVPDIRSVIDGFARTEDIRFSPRGDRIAVAGFARKCIYIIDLDKTREPVATGTHELSHDVFQSPHGLDWLDDGTLAVANREGIVVIIDVPAVKPGKNTAEARILHKIEKVCFGKSIRTPGSVALVKLEKDFGLWVCNNYAHSMSFHIVKRQENGFVSLRDFEAITEGLNVPDGISISPDGTFMAISNHNTFEVFVFRLVGPGHALRIGTLGRLDYPHGLRFTPDGRSIIVADAGQPYLHVFNTSTNWVGDHLPVRRVKVMSDRNYWRGRYNTQEGGTKGIDICNGLVVTTCETQTLRFFELQQVLGTINQA